MQIRRDSQFPLIAYFGVHLGNSHQFCLVVLDFGKSRYINGLGSNKITLVSSYFSISYALLGKFVISRSSVRLRSSAPLHCHRTKLQSHAASLDGDRKSTRL